MACLLTAAHRPEKILRRMGDREHIALVAAAAAGVVTGVAGPDQLRQYPARWAVDNDVPDMILVGASDRNGRRSVWQAINNRINLYAPGFLVDTAGVDPQNPNRNDYYQQSSGSSIGEYIVWPPLLSPPTKILTGWAA
jgi:hypothetical protein